MELAIAVGVAVAVTVAVAVAVAVGVAVGVEEGVGVGVGLGPAAPYLPPLLERSRLSRLPPPQAIIQCRSTLLCAQIGLRARR